MSRAFVSVWRLTLVAGLVCSAFVVILARLATLHLFDDGGLVSAARHTRQKFAVRPAIRGDIRDAQGNLLAVSRWQIQIGFDPVKVDPGEIDKVHQLARLLDQSSEELVQQFKMPAESGGSKAQARLVRWRKLADRVDESTYSAILALEISGVYGNRELLRHYPMRGLACHVLGYLNRDRVPVMGVERLMDFYLSGEDGWLQTERDGRRRELVQFRRRDVQARSGLHVELTLDAAVQHVIEDELATLVDSHQPKGVSVIVSEPFSGAILGLANIPNFDPNRFSEFPIENQRNRAVSDLFEPGSTFKIVPVSGVLEESLIAPQSIIDCGQKYVLFAGRQIELPEDHREFGFLSVAEIVSLSSNRGAARLGMLLGEHRLYRYARSFGFGERSGYALGGEVAGLLRPVVHWDGLTVSRLPIGYAVAATPLQVHLAMATVANGGVLMEPCIVRRIVDDAGNEVAVPGSRARRRVISERTAETVRRLLSTTTQPGGTAPEAAIAGFAVAGKTGTTRKIVEGSYSKSKHVASFSGFFPAQDPKVVITVVVDEPRNAGTAYGGRVAAPVFHRIGQRLVHFLRINPVEWQDSLIAWREERL